MESRTLQLLEFPKVLSRLASLAVSEPGREACLAIAPLADIANIEFLQAMLEESLDFCERSSFRLAEFPSLAGLFNYLSSGRQSLDLEALYAVRDVLDNFRLVESALCGKPRQEPDPDAPWPRLRALLEACAWPDSAYSGLRRCLGKDGQLRDESSPELYSIRLEIRDIHQNCLRRVKDFVQKQGLMSYLQEDFMTISSDRYVLPLKTSYKNKLPGIIHDYSQTGETCYFEPIFLVEQNNRLRGLKREESQAEAKVMAFLTGLIVSELEALKAVYQALVDFDVLWAKSELARRMRGSHIEIGLNKSLRLYDARHPLLVLASPKSGRESEPARPVNPLDILLEEGQRALAIPAQSICCR